MRVLWVASVLEDYFEVFIEKVKKIPNVGGVEVCTATTLEKAIEILSSLKIDVLITDMVFYSSLVFDQTHVRNRTRNGISLLRRIREGNFEPLSKKSMPVVIFTTFLDFLDVSDGRNTGRDFIRLDRDIQLEMLVCTKMFVDTVKLALLRARLPPGQIEIL